MRSPLSPCGRGAVGEGCGPTPHRLISKVLTLAQRPQRAVIVLRPVVLPQASGCHPDPRTHSLDNIAVRDVDSHMTNPRLKRVDKEDEIARLQCVRVGDNGSILFTILIDCNTWQLQTEVPVDVLRKPAAIETRRIGATPYIRRANELHRECCDITSLCIRH